ncbi:MAG: hypothetical protein WC774_02190 [Candidatus Gracilibacteria bacterium]|jgi:hypothetical protein
MKTSFKKVLSSVTVVTVIAMNMAVANAAVVFTGAITGGAVTPQNINSNWDGVSTPSGTSASGSDNVLVTAQVAPTLTLVISTGAIAFGTLAIGANNQSLTLTTATNAELGINVSVASLGLASPTKSIGTLIKGGTLATTGTDSYTVSSTSTLAGTVLASQAVAGTQNVLTTNNVANSNQVTTVNLNATIDAQTEAGNYGDTLTFTVTGNF